MKKLRFVLLALCALALLPAGPARAQQAAQYVQSQTYTGTTVPGAQGSMLQNSNATQHTLVWTATNTVTTCTVKLETSSDAVSWSQLGATQTCTSSGTYTVTGSATWVRFNVATFSATGTLQINYYGSAGPTAAQQTDGFFVVPPGGCSFGSSGGTVTPSTSQGLLAVGASLTNVLQIATTTGTETATVTCDVTPPSRLTAGKGITITSMIFEYGNSTGNIGTCNTPTLTTITMPVPGTSETPSTVTPVGVGGTLTVAPVVGSCNATAVTAGAFYTESITPATPVVVNSSLTAPLKLTFSQGFIGPGSASYTMYTGGVVVYYNNVPL